MYLREEKTVFRGVKIILSRTFDGYRLVGCKLLCIQKWTTNSKDTNSGHCFKCVKCKWKLTTKNRVWKTILIAYWFRAQSRESQSFQYIYHLYYCKLRFDPHKVSSIRHCIKMCVINALLMALFRSKNVKIQNWVEGDLFKIYIIFNCLDLQSSVRRTRLRLV